MQVAVPPLPPPDADLSPEDIRKLRLPYIQLLPPYREYSAAGLAPPPLRLPSTAGVCVGAGVDGAATATANGAAAATATANGGVSGGGGDGGGGGYGGGGDVSYQGQLPRLADAVWRPSCLGHVNVLGLPYPLGRNVRQELGERLLTCLAGARSRAYDTPGLGSAHWGRHGRPAQVCVCVGGGGLAARLRGRVGMGGGFGYHCGIPKSLQMLQRCTKSLQLLPSRHDTRRAHRRQRSLSTPADTPQTWR